MIIHFILFFSSMIKDLWETDVFATQLSAFQLKAELLQL